MKMLEELRNAKIAYVSALASRSGVAAAKERMKNILFNYYEDLISLSEENEKLREENESLNVALQEADEDLTKAEAELKKLASKKAHRDPAKE